MAQAVAAVIAVAGAVVSTIQAISSTRAQNNELESNAKAADLNSQIANQNAALEARRRDREVTQNTRKYNLLKGEARAQSGALGIFGGSTLDILADMDNQQLFEQTAIVDESVSAQNSYYTQSAAFKNQANGMRAGKQSVALAAIGSIIGGFSSAAGSIGSAASSAASAGSTASSAGSSLGSSAGEMLGGM